MSSPATGRIIDVIPGSLADEAGLQPGDRVLAIDGVPPRDEIDYRFRTTESVVELTVEHDGDVGVVEFEKPPDEGLGIEFGADAFGGTTLCNNRCFFCFLKGLPRGLRRTLYVKDDDYRLSFLHGNFVTLTNLDEDDWARLAEQRLSPLHLSVHATDPILRRRMLGNPAAPDVREQIRRLRSIGIEVHTQIVLCPGVNDGAALDATLAELIGHGNVRSVAVVPVGASLESQRYAGETAMRACTPAEAGAVLRQIRRAQRGARAAGGDVVVQASDELYLTAGRRVPLARAYGGFPQWENGVGMVRTLQDDWARTKRRMRAGRVEPARVVHVTLACGRLIAPTLRRLADEASALLGVRVEVVDVPNTLFGSRVNVSGLLPGAAFLARLAPIADRLGQHVFLPRASLDYFGRRFLDDRTPVDLEAALGRPVTFAYTLGEVVECMTSAASPAAARPARSNGRAWALIDEA